MTGMLEKQITLDIILETLVHVWKKHVADDYYTGKLYYGEQAVHASIAHHLRIHLSEYHDFRVLHEVNIQMINHQLRLSRPTNPIVVDLMLARSTTEQLTDDTDGIRMPKILSRTQDIDLLVMIEVKYGSDDWSDMKKLSCLKTNYLPQAFPIFAYIPGFEWFGEELDKRIQEMREEVMDSDVRLLIAKPWKPDGWDQYILNE